MDPRRLQGSRTGPNGDAPVRLVVLARHGRTVLNADGRLRGHLDPELDEVGRREAGELSRHLLPLRFTHVLSSPLRRAVQTAEVLARRSGAEVVVDPRLIDRDYGPWAGVRPDEVVARFGSVDAAPSVEPAESVATRARAVLDELVERPTTGPFGVIAHEAVNRLLLAGLDPRLGEPGSIGQRTACWNLLAHDRDGWRVVRVDQTQPLEP